ncbi:hypothetical protein AUEXF2481DRAFT_679745 [Aureobasidium subglaciale EXF-2481]|uniref:Abnormal eversion of vulva protein 20 n=3 Tax=Aureobasidium TaxID=5579 RepID=A0A074YCZ8_AURSE|nr:uncharacterized protein AUEXF2481DRAFT_679745 [Aureobasidium subglaciale EXF-2481]KEQ95648.1 hypothetical protein AUEXF2481DRAFT_679745 [Aureobasidium subglaciale EXF-2481]
MRERVERTRPTQPFLQSSFVGECKYNLAYNRKARDSLFVLSGCYFGSPFSSSLSAPLEPYSAVGMLSILRKARLKDKEMRILMLGLDNSGKTSIVKNIMGEDINTVSPTLGFIIKTIDYDGYKLNIWDVGGQKTLRTYWKNYFEKTDTLIWVVDGTDRERIDDCRQELEGLLLQERLMGASLLVFKNKSDVAGCMSSEEIRKALRLDAIHTHRWNIMECSALTGLNLQEGLQWVVQDAKDRLFLY